MKIKPTFFYLLTLASLLSMRLLIAPITQPTQAEPSQVPQSLHVLRVRASTAVERQRLLKAGWDVLEARRGEWLFVMGTDSMADKMREQGFVVEIEETLPTQRFSRSDETDGPGTFFGGYRTIAEHYSHLDAIAANHPTLAKLVDYGDSWRKLNSKPNGYDLKAICITKIRPNSSDCALNPNVDKPRFLLMAAIHARELSTSEMAWRWIDYLIDNYNVDAEVTMLLDSTEVWVIPMVNPDGRQIVEQNNISPYLQRKNANTSQGNCQNPPGITYQHGVDLNRNASFQWNLAGTDPDPCHALYPGTGPASEPEQKALEDLLRKLFKDQRGPLITDTVASNATGAMVTLHSYSDLVLFPWGGFECLGDACPADKQSPNDAALRSMAFRLSYFNKYTAGQPSEVLYAASGTSDDWAYGTLGIAAFTFEIGPFTSAERCGTFTPPFSCQDRFWALNQPAFMYAAKAARQPFTLPLGPSVISPSLSAPFVPPNGVVTLSATVSDDAYGDDGFNRPDPQAITRAEYSIDVSFDAAGAQPKPLAAADGAFNATKEVVSAQITAPPTAGRHIVYLRGCDASDTCGPTSALWLNVSQGKQVYLPVLIK